MDLTLCKRLPCSHAFQSNDSRWFLDSPASPPTLRLDGLVESLANPQRQYLVETTLAAHQGIRVDVVICYRKSAYWNYMNICKGDP